MNKVQNVKYKQKDQIQVRGRIEQYTLFEYDVATLLAYTLSFPRCDGSMEV